jgi:hypothetical protein
MRFFMEPRFFMEVRATSLIVALVLLGWFSLQVVSFAEPPADPSHHNEVVRGRVVWLAAALKERFGISTVPEVAEQSLAILTSDDQLLPLVENLRGRAFRKDERLREMELEIWVRRYDKQPLVQVLRILELKDGQRYEVDYWCDVCAIPMYETGPCACCQDHNRIRKRLLTDADLESISIELPNASE